MAEPLTTEPYDFLIIRGNSQWAKRVQVKGCEYQRTPGRYYVAGLLRDGKGRRWYNAADADAIAVVLGEDCYLIPIGELDKYKSGGKILIETGANHPALENWGCL